jgi:hypothetical protein
MLSNKDDNHIKLLHPRKTNCSLDTKNPYNINLKKILKIFPNKKIRDFLLAVDELVLYQYYYKYLYNAFEMHKSPVILFTGAKMNHSCRPNIIFFEKNNAMFFKTLTEILKGDELTYSYLRNCDLSEQKEQIKYLEYHYGFTCECQKCQK